MQAPLQPIPAGHIIQLPLPFKKKRQPKLKLTADERFWQKVEKRGLDECWNWTAGISTGSMGYGTFVNEDGKREYAHRYAFRKAHGFIPKGKDVLHRCDNPRCANAAHLFPGSDKTNCADKIAKGRQRSRLKPFEVTSLVRRFLLGEAMKILSEFFHVSERAIRDILRGKHWSKLTGIVFEPALPGQAAWSGARATFAPSFNPQMAMAA